MKPEVQNDSLSTSYYGQEIYVEARSDCARAARTARCSTTQGERDFVSSRWCLCQQCQVHPLK